MARKPTLIGIDDLVPSGSYGQSFQQIVSRLDKDALSQEVREAGFSVFMYTGPGLEPLVMPYRWPSLNTMTADEFMVSLRGKGGRGAADNPVFLSRPVIQDETPLSRGGIHILPTGEATYIDYFPSKGFDVDTATLGELRRTANELGIDVEMQGLKSADSFRREIKEFARKDPEGWESQYPLENVNKWTDPATYGNVQTTSSRDPVHTRNQIEATRIRKYYVYNENAYVSIPMTLEEATEHMMKRALTLQGLKAWKNGKPIKAGHFRKQTDNLYYKDQLVTLNPARRENLTSTNIKPTRVLADWKGGANPKSKGPDPHGTMRAPRNVHLTPIEARMLFRESKNSSPNQRGRHRQGMVQSP